MPISHVKIRYKWVKIRLRLGAKGPNEVSFFFAELNTPVNLSVRFSYIWGKRWVFRQIISKKICDGRMYPIINKNRQTGSGRVKSWRWKIISSNLDIIYPFGATW